MRIRVKFTKEGNVKFVGHLDTVRLFQRAIKAAGIPVAYSQGFNPHSLIYFAMPLSVGVSSQAEYMDIVTAEDMSCEEVRKRLEAILVKGIEIIDLFEMPSSTESLMSMVDMADYRIQIPKEALTEEERAQILVKVEGPELLVMKKGKKKVIKEVDIKPLIRHFEFKEESDFYVIETTVMAGSKQNLSPELLLQSLMGEKTATMPYSIERLELYHVDENGKAIALADYGRDQ